MKDVSLIKLDPKEREEEIRRHDEAAKKAFTWPLRLFLIIALILAVPQILYYLYQMVMDVVTGFNR